MSTCAGQCCKHIGIKCFLNSHLNFIKFDLTNVWGITSTRLTICKVRCLIFNPFCCESNGYFDGSTCSGQCRKLEQSKARSFIEQVRSSISSLSTKWMCCLIQETANFENKPNLGIGLQCAIESWHIVFLSGYLF